jgi:hypothetical protein
MIQLDRLRLDDDLQPVDCGFRQTAPGENHHKRNGQKSLHMETCSSSRYRDTEFDGDRQKRRLR